MDVRLFAIAAVALPLTGLTHRAVGRDYRLVWAVPLDWRRRIFARRNWKSLNFVIGWRSSVDFLGFRVPSRICPFPSPSLLVANLLLQVFLAGAASAFGEGAVVPAFCGCRVFRLGFAEAVGLEFFLRWGETGMVRRMNAGAPRRSRSRGSASRGASSSSRWHFHLVRVFAPYNLAEVAALSVRRLLLIQQCQLAALKLDEPILPANFFQGVVSRPGKFETNRTGIVVDLAGQNNHRLRAPLFRPATDSPRDRSTLRRRFWGHRFSSESDAVRGMAFVNAAHITAAKLIEYFCSRG